MRFRVNKREFSSDYPILLSSPHSGSYYSNEFLSQVNVSKKQLRMSEDMFVDELFLPLKDNKISIISTKTPRVYIDLNRDKSDLDPKMVTTNVKNFNYRFSKYVNSGIGLIHKVTADREKIYGKQLTIDEINRRIEEHYIPWHSSLKKALDNCINKFNFCLLLDCHSMPKSYSYSNNDELSEIILSNNHYKSCSKQEFDYLIDLFRNYGFKVGVNNPFSGGYITKKYGQPSIGINTIQIEIRRDLYMDEKKLTKKSNFYQLQKTLIEIILQLSKFIMDKNINLKVAE